MYVLWHNSIVKAEGVDASHLKTRDESAADYRKSGDSDLSPKCEVTDVHG